MPRLFWPNFDFEHELAFGNNWKPSAKLRQLNARFAPVFSALCEKDDVIVVPGTPQQTETTIGSRSICFVDEQIVRESNQFHGPDWELIPWGATESLQRLVALRGWSWDQPPIDIVRKLNDRLTSFEWEQQSGTSPAGSAVIQSEEELWEAMKGLPTSHWIIKSPFGMSARERIAGIGMILTEPQRGWVNKRLAEQKQLFLEPWMEIEGEVGLQFEIPQTGSVRLLAALPLINSKRGKYLGSKPILKETESIHWQPAIDLGLQIAEQAQQSGYFGPLGIDAVQYRDGDKLTLRPAMDINARWTMGRIAHEWGERLGLSEHATWRIADVLGD